MPAGDAFSPQQRIDIERTCDQAKQTCGLEFSVYVGADSDGRPDVRSRDVAVSMLHRLLDPGGSVLIYVDPVARALEIVTGERARVQLPDAKVGLAALSMQTSFAAGQLASGISNGIRQLADGARAIPALHMGEAAADLDR